VIATDSKCLALKKCYRQKYGFFGFLDQEKAKIELSPSQSSALMLLGGNESLKGVVPAPTELEQKQSVLSCPHTLTVEIDTSLQGVHQASSFPSQWLELQLHLPI
jgi:hypothetical protein